MVRTMRMNSHGWRTALQVAVIASVVARGVAVLAGDTAPASNRKVRIVLVGDSTVTEKSGWGAGFKQFITDGIECANTAAGGRSSMSFRQEGKWTNALALKGDYYLIQFGHNNEPGKPGRSTDLSTFIQDMKNYVDEARSIGAKPVLVTPLTRRQWDKTRSGKIKSSLAPYAEEVKKIAVQKQVPVLDLHARSIVLCEGLGREGCVALSPMKQAEGKETVDNTHLNAKGSVVFARLVVEELRHAVPELAPLLRPEPVTAAAPGEPEPDSAQVQAQADSKRVAADSSKR
jgi:pectinesterase